MHSANIGHSRSKTATKTSLMINVDLQWKKKREGKRPLTLSGGNHRIFDGQPSISTYANKPTTTASWDQEYKSGVGVAVMPRSHLLRRPYGLSFLRPIIIVRPPQNFPRSHTIAVTYVRVAARRILNKWGQTTWGCRTAFEVMTHDPLAASVRRPKSFGKSQRVCHMPQSQLTDTVGPPFGSPTATVEFMQPPQFRKSGIVKRLGHICSTARIRRRYGDNIYGIRKGSTVASGSPYGVSLYFTGRRGSP